MIKIWEVDFVKLDANSKPQDLVGTQHLNSGSAVVIAPLPGFIQRPGMSFPSINAGAHYDLYGGSVTNAIFRQTYPGTNRRSFELWFYFNGGADSIGSLWAHFNNVPTQLDGFVVDNGNAFRLYLNSSFVYSKAAINSTSWQHVILTVDRAVPQTILYYNGVQVYSSATLPGTSTTTYAWIGGFGSRESNAFMAKAATYDHILTSGDVSFLYNLGLVDEYTPNPFVARSGTVYDLTGDPLPDATVLVYDHVRETVVSKHKADSNGDYTAVFPYPGEFSIYTTKSGTPGGRASTCTVTSGGGLVVYDDL